MEEGCERDFRSRGVLTGKDWKERSRNDIQEGVTRTGEGTEIDSV